ncbi:hypothetical protein C8R46DRAFT_1137248 [Mycena filopes]|nr:hypothetical protein C8R46DRAFT_1149483 [Mycena filopes]KAJ7138561.1 hypothetical protein C8R46DRAFT_1137248 [Mycena filopes]
MFSLNSLTTVACILGVVSGTPMARQATGCSPNFEGAGVSIISGESEWGVSPVAAGTQLKKKDLGTIPLNATAEWHVEQTGLDIGSPFPTYIVKAITNNELVVEALGSAGLTLEPIDLSLDQQIWEIHCTQCFPGASSTPGGGKFAAGCAIQSFASGHCVELETGFIGFSPCLPGISAQSFDFWTATTA